MDVRAAVANGPQTKLSLETVQLEGPRAGEVLVEIRATGVCHTDAYTLSGQDSEGIFPSILGHEGAGVVVDVGPGVKSLKKGDHVIPLYTPECRECEYCLNPKTNLCQAIRATQGKGLMPDGSSRFHRGRDTLYHYMGCSTFANYTVLPEIALAKIRPDAPPDAWSEVRPDAPPDDWSEVRPDACPDVPRGARPSAGPPERCVPRSRRPWRDRAKESKPEF